jgi:hypothetical protein
MYYGVHHIDFNYFLVALWWHKRVRDYLKQKQPGSRYLEKLEDDLPLLRARARLHPIHSYRNISRDEPSILDTEATRYYYEYRLIESFMLVDVKSEMGWMKNRQAIYPEFYLEFGRYFEATKAEDRIFAMHGLMSNMSEGVDERFRLPTISYDIPLSILFERITAAMIYNTGVLNLFSLESNHDDISTKL